jgi:hypothetical protein
MSCINRENGAKRAPDHRFRDATPEQPSERPSFAAGHNNKIHFLLKRSADNLLRYSAKCHCGFPDDTIALRSESCSNKVSHPSFGVRSSCLNQLRFR